MPARVFITVAEVSGDQHAAQLVRSLRRLDPAMEIEGHGGPLMREAGATIHRETTVRARMGLAGMTRALEVWKLLRWTKAYFGRHRPDLYVGVDSPSMNFAFAKLAKSMGVPVLQYVAPQLWAWREGRIKQVRARVDHLACILPFEEGYFRERGVAATFVGHPLFDELPSGGSAAAIAAVRPTLAGRPPVVGLLTGSRRGEALTNYPDLLAVAAEVRCAFPGATFLAPTTPASHPVVVDLSRRHPDIAVALGGFDEMVPRCDLCVTVSGTATLHVAAHGVPMVVTYRMSPGVVRLGRWLMTTDTFALVNLLAPGRTHIVPEFIPLTGSPRPVVECALELLRDPAQLEAQRSRLATLVGTLDHPGASDNVARIAMGLMGRGT